MKVNGDSSEWRNSFTFTPELAFTFTLESLFNLASETAFNFIPESRSTSTGIPTFGVEAGIAPPPVGVDRAAWGNGIHYETVQTCSRSIRDQAKADSPDAPPILSLTPETSPRMTREARVWVLICGGMRGSCACREQ